MEYESITREEFGAIRRNGRGRESSPEVQLVLGLPVNEGWRFKNHVHKTNPKYNPTVCRLHSRLNAATRRAGINVPVRHDGPDLVVFRIA